MVERSQRAILSEIDKLRIQRRLPGRDQPGQAPVQEGLSRTPVDQPGQGHVPRRRGLRRGASSATRAAELDRYVAVGPADDPGLRRQVLHPPEPGRPGARGPMRPAASSDRGPAVAVAAVGRLAGLWPRGAAGAQERFRRTPPPARPSSARAPVCRRSKRRSCPTA
ncbi:MAG: hypothetical protein M0C28_23775 [Candidatus Moduliflexus flocculans]|nr:hypothetical protein [Candidatus Moduliflexus flocculans]